ncbi:unnamed protein product [Clonostachys chloroleuca]|uniref:Nephrocystin 3-like N-terminal domain-containing protein n=1 Tax=Clonostachys chloroleuca TaxID=1926264 RepID=A0AA35M5H6_9HYPO|nr:unnamed protein product [Clonostachys chloroleuca]
MKDAGSHSGHGYISGVRAGKMLPPGRTYASFSIVIVHGLHGHPYKTWVYKRETHDQQDVLEEDEDKRRKKQKISHRVIPLFRGSRSDNTDIEHQSPETLVNAQGSQDEGSCVFWPRDLLPSGCPKARVLVFGYDSKVTKYTSGATNQNSVHSHSKDLLFALMRERPSGRRLIFVAHSLGGIVVKQMLAISSAWPTSEYQDVVRSTSAVVFLGTPHRGSPDLASFGEWARSLISAFRMQTTSDILDALGMKNTDLERAQEAFSAVWQMYDFRIKTFQEGLGLRGINLGVLGNKVVPDSSSLIGDYRECAETLQANHKNMCRFFGHNDPNYRKVGGEIGFIYRSITDFDPGNLGRSELMETGSRVNMPPQSSVPETSGHWSNGQLTESDKKLLESLWFPGIDFRHQTVESPADNTCNWLFQNETYQNWFHNRDQDMYQDILLLKGKPGAGKSVLMKEAFRRSSKERSFSGSNCATAAFFFDAKGTILQRTPTGLFRSLVYQLFPRLRREFVQLRQIWSQRGFGEEASQHKPDEWSTEQLQGLFDALFEAGKPVDITIFIDALDECHPHWMRLQASFWSFATKRARKKGSRLKVCISIRHHPLITFENGAEVIVEHHNDQDIATYVKQKLPCDSERQEGKWEEIRRAIIRKSAGVFLWVILVLEKVLRMWDEGEHHRYILSQLETVPEALRSLFSQLFEGSTAASKALAVKLFRWVILAVKPLRLREWHHILAFCKQPGLSSLKEWRESFSFTEDDEQLERQIKAISKGLIEVTSRPTVSQADIVDSSSVRAGAGSLDLDNGETRVVRVIHQSVCEFFENDEGFAILTRDITTLGASELLDGILATPQAYVVEGHLYIMNTALDYMGIRELDALVEARRRAAEHVACAEPNPGSTALQPHLGLSGDVEPCGKPGLPLRPTPKHPFSEMAGAFQDVDGTIDIPQWISASKEGMIRGPHDAAEIESIKTSVSVHSQTLDDHPALLLYVTSEFFNHARLAQSHGADPTDIINRLYLGGGWNRMSILREDKDTIQPLTEGLPSWVRAMEYMGLVQKEDQSPLAEGNSNNELSLAMDIGQQGEDDDVRHTTRRMVKRRGSVASFSSAGSFASVTSYR